jgi:hypothetical protein
MKKLFLIFLINIEAGARTFSAVRPLYLSPTFIFSVIAKSKESYVLHIYKNDEKKLLTAFELVVVY